MQQQTDDASTHKIPPLIIDARGEAAIRHHVENVGALLPEGVDSWEYVQAQIRQIYGEQVRKNPYLYCSDPAPLAQDGVLYPLPLVKGIGVLFIVQPAGVTPGVQREVAAVIWLSAASVVHCFQGKQNA